MRRTARPWQIEITVEGINLERFVRRAGEKHIPLTAMRRKGSRRLIARVRESDLTALQELAVQGGWRLKYGQRYGVGKAAFWLQRRWLLSMLLVLSAVMIAAVSQVMWQVEITGAGTYEADICLALEEMGITPPKLRNQVDIDSLREVIDACLTDAAYEQGRREVTAETWAHQGEGAVRVADYLMHKYEELTKKNGGDVQ